MKIVHISVECYPVAKVGGLADVVGALPKYQNIKGIETQVIMPFYNNKFTKSNSFSIVYESELKLGDVTFNFKIKKLKNSKLGFDLFLVDIPQFFFFDFVYTSDDAERFLAFQIAGLEWMLEKRLLKN